jgi:glucose-1-phosphate cytidylyltransferase
MKVVILCGGVGTRLREETEFRPKPMVPVGEKPILWHIMKHHAHFGHREFYLALGYKGEVIRRYFHEYHALSQDVTVDLSTGHVHIQGEASDRWLVHLIDTGATTNTGGRVRRMQQHLQGEAFLLTYGDGVSDVNLDHLIAFHGRAKRIVTLTAVQPIPQFGALSLAGDAVKGFAEKKRGRGGWVNGGFMVVEPEFFRYLKDDSTGLEVLEQVAQDGQVAAYRHRGYWQCMDTLRDKEKLEAEWQSGRPAWKVWS